MQRNYLTRDEFRESVFKRDRYLCIICSSPAVDAHHLIERRLWGDSGGYLIDNGVSVCAPCHIKAERTLLSCEELREAARIKNVVLPEHFSDGVYDKWGNPILDNGLRLQGELFHDASVQKILGEGKVLHLFTNKVKYPRTLHLPWSPGVFSDDRVQSDLSGFKKSYDKGNIDIVVLEKRDGECTNLMRDCIYARSLDYGPHPSRTWIKALHAQISQDIPDGWRISGENLYAKHSIKYFGLRSYFEVFSIWNDKNVCLSWDETLEWVSLLGLVTVPVIYRGEFDIDKLRALRINTETQEGYVVRPVDSFLFKDFSKLVLKYVRKNHVQTDEHWRNSAIELNQLA